MTDVPLGITVAVGLAFALELLVGEPPADYHPIALFGRVVGRVERREWRAPRAAGTAVAVGFPLAAAAVVYVALSATTGFPGIVVSVLAGLVLWVSSSLRLLLEAGERVIAHSEPDPEAAREALPALVGRDPTSLSPPLIRSAAV